MISRADAIGLQLPRYFTGDACSNGHTAERYVRNRCCVVCTEHSNEQRRKAFPRAKPNHKAWDWNHLTVPQVEIWYARVEALRRGKTKTYRHHPLDESAVFVPKKK